MTDIEKITQLYKEMYTAALIGRSRLNAVMFGSGRHTWRLQLRFQLVNKNNDWCFASASASTY